MRTFLFLLLTMLLPLASEGAWIVNSQFQLQLNEGLFDKIIEDFWQSMQGEQQIDIGSFTVNPGGIPIRIEGVRANVNYAFSLPQRVGERTREWEIHSENLGASLHIDKISATQIVEREIDGIIIRVRLEADCRNVTLKLPPGLTQVSARIRADVVQNQVKLSLPAYDAAWATGAWQVVNMQCTGVEGFDQIVRSEALKALSRFQNFDTQVHEAMTQNFAQWSKDASRLLLSEQELPSGKDYLKVYYRPQAAVENGNGLILTGDLRFEYPYVSPDQTIEQSYALKQSALSASANPQLLLPFDTVRALMMGEYFAGQLEYSLFSTEIPAFTDFMQSRWQQFWAFPELQTYPKDTKFAFQFLPLGPPSLRNERAGGTNAVSADLMLPLAVRMFAPLNGKYRPMVEFRTYISGPTSLKILPNGKIEFRLSTQAYPVNYAWAHNYIGKYNPTQRIAIDTISSKVRSALSSEGFTLAIPSFTVGRQLQLAPQGWNLVGGNIVLDFNAKSALRN